MAAIPRQTVMREAATSFAINAMLSLAFFALLYGLTPRLLAWGAPDRLALDFVPQSIAVALMSALVPCLILRRRLRLPIGIQPIVLRASLFALLGGLVGAAMAALCASLPPIGWTTALLLKLGYGGTLGAAITTVCIGRLTA
ncbi:hypothetical protein FHS96_003725 [Sphingomonas zeicaulis]|uniref:hypothetical protein n=1 Tax=Sphingomonas zeicaulis TaxID=1632740 RepID=UPI003D22AA93